MGNYRVFMRSFDDGGRISAWSAAFNFEVAPPVILTRPKGVTFDNPPLLEWELVPGATDYDVTLAKASSPSTYVFNLQKHIGTSYQVPKALESGDYVFMVRRAPTCRGAGGNSWSLEFTGQFFDDQQTNHYRPSRR